MRGWTNVAGGGMALNAEVQDLVVANGKSVVVGDFVETYTVKSESVLTYADIKQGKTEQISENLVITQSGETLYLLKMEGGRLNIADSYNEKSVGGYCVMESGEIAVAVKSKPYLVKIKAENGLITVISEAQGVDSISIESTYGISVEEKDGKLYVIGTERSGAPPIYDYHGKLYVFKENEGGGIEIESPSYTELRLLSSKRSYYYMIGTFSAGGYIYCCFREENEFNELVKVSVDKNGESNTERITVYTVNSLFPVTFWNKYAIWSSTETEESALYIYNAQTGNTVRMAMSGFGFPIEDNTMTKRGTRTAFAKYGENILSIFFSGGSSIYLNAAVFKVANSGNLEQMSNIFKVEYDAASFIIADLYLFVLDSTMNPACYFNNATHCLAVSYNSGSNELTDFVQPSYVKPYEGGSAIGVAKQSGASGQAVEVYVAKPSA